MNLRQLKVEKAQILRFGCLRNNSQMRLIHTNVVVDQHQMLAIEIQNEANVYIN